MSELVERQAHLLDCNKFGISPRSKCTCDVAKVSGVQKSAEAMLKPLVDALYKQIVEDEKPGL